ncbi:unnamed protein product [Phaedon cochleariae]|uniref:Uncharacterized protein n=1 Tax=Phaedon cochleariae TaxID=80249 RepID=A0A9N9SH13_PHACE|nr:unnamed protein product [Phaedon cochleariae]
MTSFLEINYSLCFICQQDTEEKLVENPTGYGKLFECMKSRNEFRDPAHIHLKHIMTTITAQNLEDNSATWHGTCYSKITHKKEMTRIQKLLSTESSSSRETNIILRSKISNRDKNACFFCEKYATKKSILSTVMTDDAGKRMRDAVLLENNEGLKIKLSEFISENDAHAYDIKYYSSCWITNVVNILREQENKSCHEFHNKLVASEVELLSRLRITLFSGSITNMEEVENLYNEICTSNDLPEQIRKTRKYLKTACNTRMCKCLMNKLKCTEMCECESASDTCTNNLMFSDEDIDDDSSSENE